MHFSSASDVAFEHTFVCSVYHYKFRRHSTCKWNWLYFYYNLLYVVSKFLAKFYLFLVANKVLVIKKIQKFLSTDSTTNFLSLNSVPKLIIRSFKSVIIK